MLFRSDRKSTRLNSSHTLISYAVFCLKKKKTRVARATSFRSWPVTARRPLIPASPQLNIAPLPCQGQQLDDLAIRAFIFFFLNDGAPPEIYPLPPPAALPI